MDDEKIRELSETLVELSEDKTVCLAMFLSITKMLIALVGEENAYTLIMKLVNTIKEAIKKGDVDE